MSYDPMFHMDDDYMWRWYRTNVTGDPVCMSTKSFFSLEDARLDYDVVNQQPIA